MGEKEKAIELVRQLITHWGLKEEDCVNKENKELWHFTQGSVSFHIEFFKFNRSDTDSIDGLEVGSALIPIPEDKGKRDALYEHVLNMNSTSCGVWFAKRNNLLILLTSREITGMDFNELKTMADDVRFYADYYDDIFKKEYGDNYREPGR